MYNAQNSKSYSTAQQRTKNYNKEGRQLEVGVRIVRFPDCYRLYWSFSKLHCSCSRLHWSCFGLYWSCSRLHCSALEPFQVPLKLGAEAVFSRILSTNSFICHFINTTLDRGCTNGDWQMEGVAIINYSKSPI